MTYTVVTTERAARETEDAAAWWSQHRSVEQAESWYAGIRKAIMELSEDPDRWQVAAEQCRFSYEIRELHYGIGSTSQPTHRVIFTKVGQTVLVLSVGHAASRSLRPRDLR
jgi:plasmid stabilization system protein ParE